MNAEGIKNTDITNAENEPQSHEYRYFIELSYKGTQYHGWQKQVSANSVQETLETGLSKILGATIEVTGAGRTDTGVHASFFVAHFDLAFPIQNLQNTVFHLNCVLPTDISVNKIYRVKNEIHSRFSALSRTYQYYIHTHKNPFLNEVSYFHYGTLDLELMNQCCELLKTYDDFTTFSKLHSDNQTNICRIDKAFWEQNGQNIVFTIQADRFLRNMVRAICGTLLKVGMHRISYLQFKAIIESKNRAKMQSSAPAQGLFLTAIQYPDTINFEQITDC